MDAGCATFMTSFTDNDGVPASGDTFYYANYCVTSGGMRHGRLGLEVYFRDGQTRLLRSKRGGFKAVQAGVNMEMVSETYRTYLAELIDEGVLCRDH